MVYILYIYSDITIQVIVLHHVRFGSNYGGKQLLKGQALPLAVLLVADQLENKALSWFVMVTSVALLIGINKSISIGLCHF